MKEIKEIVKDIRDELEGAEHYAMKSVKLRATDSTAAARYAEMSRQELMHADNLHRMAVDLIEKHRAAGHEAPEAMRIIWEWEHENMMNREAKIRMMLDMSK